MESSRGVVPHHFGLRVIVMRCAVLSMLETMNGPADGGGLFRKPLLNASGVDVTDFG